MNELKIDVFGRVQGVGFRQFVKKTSDQLGIKGFVRNAVDGRVSLVAQGSRSDLQDFLLRVQKGPFFSKVSGVSYVWRVPTNTYPDFIIAVDKPFIFDQASSFTNLGKNLFNSQKNVPRHVAIIPDGNRRWARERGMQGSDGHRASITYEKISSLLNEAKQLGISHFTFWGFSTDNWKRDAKEIEIIFDLAVDILRLFREKVLEHQVRFRHFGRRDRLPARLVQEIEQLEEATKQFTKHSLHICLDYGGRDELARAVNRILKAGVEQVNEDDVLHYLDTEGVPDLDLIIRTSGEQRTSGFMPYQGTYAELYFTDLHFPDFGPEQLRVAVEEFSRRKRTFGK